MPLLSLNLSLDPTIPWSVPVTGGILWVGWDVASGLRGGSTVMREQRRRLLRAGPLPAGPFAWAIAAGLMAILALGGASSSSGRVSWRPVTCRTTRRIRR